MPYTGINQGGIVQPTDVPSLQPQAEVPSTLPGVLGQVPAGANPVQLAQQSDQQELLQLSQLDQQLEALQAPVRKALQTAYDQYRVDYTDLATSDMDAMQKAQRLSKLKASYQKKMIALKAKNALEREAIQQQRMQVEQQLKLKQAFRMKEIQVYGELAKQGVLSPEDALRLQYKAVGYDIPITSLRPEKPQNPVQRLQTIQPILRTWDEELLHYRTHPKTGRLQRLNPAVAGTKDKYSDKDWLDLDPAGQMAFFRRQAEFKVLSQEADQLRSLIGIGRTTDLYGAARKAAAPLVKGVAAETPREGVDVTKLSDEELRRIAGL